MTENARKPKQNGEITCPEWMVTLGDTMSLLLTFFVLILTFSTVNADQLSDMLGVMQGALGTIKTETCHSVTGAYKDKSEDLSPVLLNLPGMPMRLHAVRRKLHALGFRETITLDILDQGVRMRIPTRELLRDDGDLREQTRTALQEFANLLAGTRNEIRVTVELEASLGTVENMCQVAGATGGKVSAFLIDDCRLSRARFSQGLRLLQDPAGAATVEIMLMQKPEIGRLSFRDVLKVKDVGS